LKLHPDFDTTLFCVPIFVELAKQMLLEYQRIKGIELGPLSPEERWEEAYQLRIRTAGYYRAHRIPVHQSNDDEDRYKNHNFYPNYTKGLKYENI
jgi:hypothetical protein